MLRFPGEDAAESAATGCGIAGCLTLYLFPSSSGHRALAAVYSDSVECHMDLMSPSEKVVQGHASARLLF